MHSYLLHDMLIVCPKYCNIIRIHIHFKDFLGDKAIPIQRHAGTFAKYLQLDSHLHASI